MPEKESSQNEAFVDSERNNSDGKENTRKEKDLSKADLGWDKPDADGISAKVHRGKAKSTKKEMREKFHQRLIPDPNDLWGQHISDKGNT